MLIKSARSFVFLFVILALTTLACGIDFGDETPAPPIESVEPVQQPEEPPTQELEASPEPQEPANQPFFKEEFEGDPTDWTYFVTKNKANADDSNVAPFSDNGYFVFDIGKNLNVYATYDPYSYEDVRIDVSVDNRGHNNNNINLVCRYSDAGWYEVAIANNGLYWIWVYDTNIENYSLLVNGGSNKIRQGKDDNQYTMTCNDNNISLSINGTETKTFTDTKYGLGEGLIGVGLSSFDFVPIEVGFDWIEISEP